VPSVVERVDWLVLLSQLTADQSPIEVVIQLEQNDVTRANRDVALGRFTHYKWVVLGISLAVLSAMFAFLIFR
jgi:lipoprotein signal peptidase